MPLRRPYLPTSRRFHIVSAIVAIYCALGVPAIAAGDSYSPAAGNDSGGAYGDAYRPDPGYAGEGTRVAPAPAGSDVYSPEPQYEPRYQPEPAYDPRTSERGVDRRRDSFSGNSVPEPSGYGDPYTAPSGAAPAAEPGYPEPQSPREAGATYEQHEIIDAGHQFFGTVSKGIAQGIEYVFRSQGRPNGYIVGEDAGGAFVVGLRYGEGTLHTKFAGSHKMFWQGPSVGYDAGAEGSKVMILVYNLSDPAEIFHRFGGVQGSAYVVGGVGVQLQQYGDVTLAVIRSGVGLRLGANVGYMKYTRTPTWNPL